MFAFTSMAANIDNSVNHGSGPYVFKISDEVHHFMGSLLHDQNHSPKFAQLYIHDTNNEVENRISALDPGGINRATVEGLMNMLLE